MDLRIKRIETHLTEEYDDDQSEDDANSFKNISTMYVLKSLTYSPLLIQYVVEGEM
jgi:hypothetical protein